MIDTLEQEKGSEGKYCSTFGYKNSVFWSTPWQRDDWSHSQLHQKPFHKRKWYSGNRFCLHNLHNPHRKVGYDCTWTRQIVCDEHDGVIITHQCFFGKPSLKVSGLQSLKSWVHLRHPSHSCMGSGWCLVRLGMVDDTPCCPMMMQKICRPAAAASSNFTSFSSQTKPLTSGFHHCFTYSLCPFLWCCNPKHDPWYISPYCLLRLLLLLLPTGQRISGWWNIMQICSFVIILWDLML